MWKYPLTSDKNGYVPLEDALQWCNMSFYDGFIAAFCESPEDYEAINTEDRIALVLAAIERNAILRRETPTQPDFIGGGYRKYNPYSLQAVTGRCRAVERGRSCMNGKHLPLLRLEPPEAIALFPYAKTEEMYRVKDLYTAYREARGTDTDSLWDIMSLLSFVYDTARIQGIREERARRT